MFNLITYYFFELGTVLSSSMLRTCGRGDAASKPSKEDPTPRMAPSPLALAVFDADDCPTGLPASCCPGRTLSIERIGPEQGPACDKPSCESGAELKWSFTGIMVSWM